MKFRPLHDRVLVRRIEAEENDKRAPKSSRAVRPLNFRTIVFVCLCVDWPTLA
jgi:hypothetical protein